MAASGAKYGMMTLDSHLMALFQAGRIHYEDLITKAQDPNSVVQRLEEMAKQKKYPEVYLGVGKERVAKAVVPGS